MQWKYPYFSVIDVSVVEQSIVSTGPYKLDSMQAGVGAELSRNEYYWNGEVPYFTSCKRKSPAFAGLFRQAQKDTLRRVFLFGFRRPEAGSPFPSPPVCLCLELNRKGC